MTLATAEYTDADMLIDALENDSNHDILNLTTDKINTIKSGIFDELSIDAVSRKKLTAQLDGYIYIDEIPNFKVGSFIRWVSLNNLPDVKLTRGGYVCYINITGIGTGVVVKTVFGKFIHLYIDKIVAFRKLSNAELILLHAMNYLDISI